jgi:NADPH:quinone reductase-like Zn-dependent oxidoreductase
MRSIHFSAYGDADSIHLVEQPPRPVGPTEVRVDVDAAPLNPSDFLLLDGSYGIRPELPSGAGAEAVGMVREVGRAVTRASVGQQVLVLPSDTPGTWQDEVVVDQRHVVPVHRPADAVQLATVPINAATAHLLFETAAPLPAGSWVVQTAANSGLGAFVRVLAARAGLRLVDVVRNERAASALRAAGAAHVVVGDDTLDDQLRRVLGDQPVTAVFDGVGGDLIDAFLPYLAVGGRIVSFAALSGQPIVVPAGMLNFKSLHVIGFWLHNWLSTAPADEIDAVYRQLIDLVADGVLQTPVQARYPLTSYAEAIAAARVYGRDGKVFFTRADEADHR